MKITFETIEDKIENNVRLDAEEALWLYEHNDLLRIGELADKKNRLLNNSKVFFNINRHINPTNICVLNCKFCAFSKKPGQEGAYAYTIEEMVKKAGIAAKQGATEVHMVGGLHPRWKFEYYLEMLTAIKTAYPKLHIKAFTAVEIDWFVKKTKSGISEVLVRLKEAGLGSMPGGGAEIFDDEVRDKICETKVTADQWLDTHRVAHSLGLNTNATMLYGHIESYKHRVHHMELLRKLQDETKGFNAFIPLSFQPHSNDLGINRYTMGSDDLRNIAIARLFLDNFQHIKAYWVMLGPSIAQLALKFGANDIDGTVVEEKISHMAGGRSGMQLDIKQISHLITNVGFTPQERDTVYQPIQRDRDIFTQPISFEGFYPSKEMRSYYQKMGDFEDTTIDLRNTETFIIEQNPVESISEWIDLNIKDSDVSAIRVQCASRDITAYDYLKAIVQIQKHQLNIPIVATLDDLSTIDPKSCGEAINQDPRFKVLALLRLFGVRVSTDQLNADQKVLVQTEFCMLKAMPLENQTRVN